MNFTCDLILILEGDESSKDTIFDSLLEDCNIPTCVVTDKNNKLYKAVKKLKPSDIDLKSIIITTKYNQIFTA